VELRILAHVAGVDELLHAFQHGVDVHTLTASQVFQARRRAPPRELST
jgi:DNA polymerase-1